MKRSGIAKIYKTICLVFLLAVISGNGLTVRADEIVATVEGTVMSGTTADLLKLSTKGGNMEIKLDSGTDASACKILLPDKKINVSLSHKSDGYLYAVKITSDSQTPGVSLDASTTTTVTGTIGEKTKDDLIYFNTKQGEMQIKLDATTGLSGCSLLVMGKTYNISCARGSDAYMHAISISDADAAGAANTPGTTNTADSSSPVNNNIATMSVTGTVTERTKESRLYLSTKEGVMQFVIDSNADTSKGMVHTPGSKLTVSFYHGTDGYLHAVGIVGVKDSQAAVEIDTSNTATVSGTVEEDSTENVLYLKTAQGTMQLKLDAVKSVNNCKVLVNDRKLTVTCARGSDAYMHALDITADNT